MLTFRSTLVRLIGVAVALRMSFVSWPVKTTTPWIQGVLRSVAPLSKS